MKNRVLFRVALAAFSLAAASSLLWGFPVPFRHGVLVVHVSRRLSGGAPPPDGRSSSSWEPHARDVRVAILRDGKEVTYGTTDGDGTVTFRLVSGDYVVRSRASTNEPATLCAFQTLNVNLVDFVSLPTPPR